MIHNYQEYYFFLLYSLLELHPEETDQRIIYILNCKTNFIGSSINYFSKIMIGESVSLNASNITFQEISFIFIRNLGEYSSILKPAFFIDYGEASMFKLINCSLSINKVLPTAAKGLNFKYLFQAVQNKISIHLTHCDLEYFLATGIMYSSNFIYLYFNFSTFSNSKSLFINIFYFF